MKISIVDDHPIVRAGLRRLLAAEPGMELAEAASGHEAMTLVRSFQPEIMILDLNLPGVGGFDIIARLARDKPRPRILVLSMHDDPIFAMRALEAGADGYVSKNAPPIQILEALARLAKGQTYVGEELAQQLALWNLRSPKQHPLQGFCRGAISTSSACSAQGKACNRSRMRWASATRPSPTIARSSKPSSASPAPPS